MMSPWVDDEIRTSVNHKAVPLENSPRAFPHRRYRRYEVTMHSRKQTV